MGKNSLKFRVTKQPDGTYLLERRIRHEWLLKWEVVGSYPTEDECYQTGDKSEQETNQESHETNDRVQ